MYELLIALYGIWIVGVDDLDYKLFSGPLSH